MNRRVASTKQILLKCVLKRNIDPVLPIIEMSSNEVFLDYTVNLIKDCLTYLWMMDNEALQQMVNSIQEVLEKHSRQVVLFPKMSSDGHRLFASNIRNTVRVLNGSPVINQNDDTIAIKTALNTFLNYEPSCGRLFWGAWGALDPSPESSPEGH